MKKFFKFSLLAVVAALSTTSFSSCSDDDTPSPTTIDSEEFEAILKQYVDNTVIPTYNRLADASIELETACNTLYEHKKANTATDSDVKAVCDAWISARKYWEQSEAFLLGPATINGIDPHIDSWPLDKTALDNLLSNAAIMSTLDASYITTNYGSGGLCGFHALEYAVFNEGVAKNVSDISENLAKYAYAVSGDLKLQCIILEASWAGVDNVTQDKKNLLEKEEAVPDNNSSNWGEQFKNAGNAGSRYRTQMEAIVDFLKADKGCFGIANEVGDTKISDPVDSQNVLDVESWYSFNSKVDFQDNIRGIENVVMGGVSDKRDTSKSIYSFLQSKNPTLAKELKDAIDTCIGSDGSTGLGTIIQPFRNNLQPEKNQKAIESCQALREKLSQVATYLQAM
ncbi:imelysin family protein [uncultured Bacteroides sp.]|uniref:imelysin family protein n=1 Tax=uncultured Bacteroides sp. TaxID=162156 RepID=UPI0025E0D53D|nr:imelysin family protein [uncultured Bacteroides sp.]